MSKATARLALVLAALTLAACAAPTAPTSQATAGAQRAKATNPTVQSMCGGGGTTVGTGQC
jgi:hypothetical protein